MKARARSAGPARRRASKSNDRRAVDVETATRERYGKAAAKVEQNLCCAPTTYAAELMENVPEKIRDVDYGCGDPTPWAQAGDTVLDLGSGSGKACYMLAQTVGRRGRVIGVDFNPPMLALARSARAEFGRRTGLRNIEFRRGRIQDLALDLDLLEIWLRRHPVKTADDLLALEAETARLRRERPLIESDSVDLVVSNCVLNLARDEDKPALFGEMFRVLRSGGRCVISDIVSDERSPEHLKRDPELWSGCLSGAMQEMEFLRAFEEAGFHAVEILKREEKPWRTIEGIEYRSITVRAHKGKHGPCLEKKQAVIYRGPWREVVDDDGHTLRRGERMAVCEKTLGIYTSEPYSDQIIPIEPLRPLRGRPQPFDCSRDAVRHPRETKGRNYRATKSSGGNGTCDPSTGCC
jgi:SAM-dependent methyltransferase